MRIEFIRWTVPLAVAAAVSGCATDGALPNLLGGVDTFGEANRQTMAAQIIDPDPHYDYAVPVTSGEQAALAIERYRTDKVKQPERVKTSKSLTGGSSSSSGSGPGSGGSN